MGPKAGSFLAFMDAIGGGGVLRTSNARKELKQYRCICLNEKDEAVAITVTAFSPQQARDKIKAQGDYRFLTIKNRSVDK